MTLNFTTTDIVTTSIDKILTRPYITPAPVYIHRESCLVSEMDEYDVMITVLVYGMFYTFYMIYKGIRSMRKYHPQTDEWDDMNYCTHMLLFGRDVIKKRHIYFTILCHIWNQATDIGVVVEIYYLSFTDCAIGYTLLYRLFGLGIAFLLFYRFVTSIMVMYATQKPYYFFYQLIDLLLIQNLELDYIFNTTSVNEIQTWIIWSSCCFQSFGMMLIAAGVMTLTQGYYDHPVLLCSIVVSFISCIYSIILNDRILYNPFAHYLRFDREEITSVDLEASRKAIMRGYCCYCNGFRLEYIYRVLFRAVDFQFRVFILTFIWTAIGGVYLALYLFIEFLVLYTKARNIGRYQLLTGLLGVVINYTSSEAKRFCEKFTIYRFIGRFVWLILIYICVNVPATDYIPISDAYELRRSDFYGPRNIIHVYWYLVFIAVFEPWLYYGPLQSGDVIRTDLEAATTNVRDPFCIIAKKDFETFLHLIVFGNIFYHGNEWVLQGLLDAMKEDAFRILPKYFKLLLSAYEWDFTKISYYTKSKFFAAIMQVNDRSLCKLLFDRMAACNDSKGIESGLLYWCQTRAFNEDNNEFLRIIKLIQSKFDIKSFHPLAQSKLLKYTILRASQLADLNPFRMLLTYRLAPETLSHIYLHYTDFVVDESSAFNADIFADILHSIFHVKHFVFNVDNVTAKCFLYWALKFELWETVHEILKHKHHSKQVYSTYDSDEPFLHLVCKTICDYGIDSDISRNLCSIADVCINELYVPLNETNKSKITTLMYAAQMLHIPLISTILKYGPNKERKDIQGHDCKWYIDNNYWITNMKITSEKEEEEKQQNAAALIDIDVKITMDEMNKRKKLALELINRSLDDMNEEEDDFIESYEERYDQFILSDRELHLYRSTKYDINVLFEAIGIQDFQRIIDLIDEHKFDANMPTVDGTSPLHLACEHSGALVIKYLMDRGAFPFAIENNLCFPINMIEQNNIADDAEKKFMVRLLDVRDVDHDPFALTDKRVLEIERIQSFARIFARYLLLLFIIWFITFSTSVGLTDRFHFGYISPL